MAEAKGKKDSPVGKSKARSKTAGAKSSKTSDEVKSNAPEQLDDIVFNRPSDSSPAKASKEVSPVQAVDSSDDDLVFTPKKKTPVKVKTVEKVEDSAPSKESYIAAEQVLPQQDRSTDGPAVRDMPKYTVRPEDMADEIALENNGPSAESFLAANEESKSKVYDDEVNSRYEEIKRGGNHLTDLQQKSLPELLAIAKEVGITEVEGLTKQNLVFLIIKERVKQNGLMLGEGTLEILPDGFGFLRSPDYNCQ